jgi:hypothetical protein
MGVNAQKVYPPTTMGLMEALEDELPFAQAIDIREFDWVGKVAVSVRLPWWTLGLVNGLARKRIETVFKRVLAIGVVGRIEYVGIRRLF